jgi:hypothetical protein
MNLLDIQYVKGDYLSLIIPIVYSLTFTNNFQIIKIFIILRELDLSFLIHLDTTVSLS